MTTSHRFTALHTVAVPVTDQAAAVTYYTDVLGMEVRLDADLQEGFRWVEVAPPGAATSIALVAEEPSMPAGRDTGVRLLSPDAAAHHAALSAAGAAVGELLRWDGVPPMFTMRDLDGNTLYVTEAGA